MDTEYLKYNFEDRYDGVITKKRFRIGIRHLQVLYMFLCSLVFGLLRGSNSLAIRAIADETRQNDTYIQVKTWDRRVQGSILTSYFLGYALLVIPAQLKVFKYGSKMLLTLMLFINGIMTALLPTIVNKGSWLDVRTANFLLGATQACLAPAQQTLLATWIPPNERNFLSAFVFSGIQIGIILAFPLSSMLMEANLGWELVLYAQAMMALPMAIIWCLLTSNSPKQHQAINDSEKEYIQDALSQYTKKPLDIPWSCLLVSSRVWAICLSHAASYAVFVFCLTEAPHYLQAHHFSLRQSTWLNSFPILTMALVYMIASPTMSWLSSFGITSYVMSATTFRKMINILGATGVIICLTILLKLDGDCPLLAVSGLMATLGCIGIQFCGFLENLKDMSDNYQGTLFVLSSQVSSLVAALIPYCSGIIVSDVRDLKQWRIIMMTLIVFYTFCNAFYMVFASSERQNWDGTPTKDKFGYQNSGLDDNHLELQDIEKPKTLDQGDINTIVI